jgi:RimJ/RimL family protein N-acetyltransferase
MMNLVQANALFPTALTGDKIRLEPLEARHAPDLARQVSPETFRYFSSDCIPGPETVSMLRYIESMTKWPTVGPFAVVLAASGVAIGSSCYLDIRTEHLGVEIGATWYGDDYHGTFVNPECKLLLLRHAFSEGYERVQLKTDGRNLRSQAAIAKLGAKLEGVLRKHIQMPDGFIRDSVMYSIIRSEWPAVEASLRARLNELA